MQCPDCERPTFRPERIVSRDGRNYEPIPEGFLWAIDKTGHCTTCWRGKNGRTYPHRDEYKPPFDLGRARSARERFEARRRARGVPEDGLPAERLVKPGLFLAEVP